MPWQAAWGMTDAKGKLKVAFPPTVYYEMVHDPQTSAQIAQESSAGRGAGWGWGCQRALASPVWKPDSCTKPSLARLARLALTSPPNPSHPLPTAGAAHLQSQRRARRQDRHA